jgi:hypothetical protein
VIVIPLILSAYSTGPPDGYAGDPPNYNNCTSCHNSFPPNSGDGTLNLLNLPGKYVPEQEYTIFVFLKDTLGLRWGFEMTVIDSTGFQAGEMINTDNTVQISQGSGNLRDYAKHTSIGTFPGQQDSAIWELKWTAPIQGTGTVYFYLAGNAANNNGVPSGDYIYTKQFTIPESTLALKEKNSLSRGFNFNIYPNPASKRIQVVFNLGNPSKVRIKLIDVSGRTFDIYKGFLKEGKNVLNFNLDKMNLNSSSYYIVTEVRKLRLKKHILIIK